MNNIFRLMVALGAAFFIASAQAQNSGTLTNHAFAIGKGAGTTGYTSLLCGSAQLAVGQSAADPICQTITGDVTISSGGVTAIGTAKVTSAMLRNSGALSVIGRSANSSGVPADISCTAASDAVLRESGSVLGCGQIATNGIANNAVTLAKLATQGANTVLANATSGAAVPTAFSMPSCSTSASALIWTTNTGFGCNTAISVAIANVTGLGTGVGTALAINTGSAGAVVLFNGAGGTPSSLTLTNATGLPTTGLTGTLQAAQEPAHTGDVTNSAGSLAMTIAANAVTNAKMATMAANTVKANATGSTATPTDVTAATARSSSLLNVDSFTGHGDSIYTILATDRTVGTNASFTASRTWTLPAANAVNPGQEIIVADFQGTVTGTNTLVIARAGSDTINGVTSVTISSANGAYLLKSDGTSKWTAQALGAAAAGGVSSVTCGTGLSGGTITTSGTCAVSNLSTNTNFVMSTGVAASFNPNVTNYAGASNICGSGSEVACYIPVSAPATFKNFYAATSVAPAGVQTYTFTLRSGSYGSTADSSITCTITGSATTCSDLTHTLSVTAGQMVSIKMVSSATAAAVSGITFGMTAVTTSP